MGQGLIGMKQGEERKLTILQKWVMALLGLAEYFHLMRH
jgi:hypothetical protein